MNTISSILLSYKMGEILGTITKYISPWLAGGIFRCLGIRLSTASFSLTVLYVQDTIWYSVIQIGIEGSMLIFYG